MRMMSEGALHMYEHFHEMEWASMSKCQMQSEILFYRSVLCAPCQRHSGSILHRLLHYFGVWFHFNCTPIHTHRGTQEARCLILISSNGALLLLLFWIYEKSMQLRGRSHCVQLWVARFEMTACDYDYDDDDEK